MSLIFVNQPGYDSEIVTGSGEQVVTPAPHAADCNTDELEAAARLERELEELGYTDEHDSTALSALESVVAERLGTRH